MTIKWVKVDPLVMNGEPFCYGTRLTVRNILEMRSNGLTPSGILGENPELRRVGIAEVFRYAAEHMERYEDFFQADGTLIGPGFTAEEAAMLPAHLRSATGIVVSTGEPEPVPTHR
ncbi:MAG: hypothetical protein QOH61_291 [Chloroflexota bacterium]|jgi:uncharacterized protein (DUF433 family)|nr:hypothetical protein [Chloroflexota bacterium]